MKVNKKKEVLTNFEEQTIAQAARELKKNSLPIPKTKDLPKPEAETKVENLTKFETLERVIGRPNFLPANFLEEGSIIQKAVARVAFREAYNSFDIGDGWASGFMVSSTLFLTNNHVIPTKSFAKKLMAQFNYQLDLRGNPLTVDEYVFDPEDVFHTNEKLDYTLISVRKKCTYGSYNTLLGIPNNEINEYTPNPFDPIDIGFDIDLRNRIKDDWIRNWRRICYFPGIKHGHINLSKTIDFKRASFLNIIQHPDARRKEVALQENGIEDIFLNKIRYTTDTEGGSSGSPVFNNSWELVAVHHAAGEWDDDSKKWINNQGIRIDKISQDLRSHFEGSAKGRDILNVLGI